MAELIQTRSAEQNSFSAGISVSLITMIISYILCVFMFSFFGNFERIFHADSYLDYKVGDVVREDIYSDIDLFLIDETATARKKDLAESMAYPVFKIYVNITRDVLAAYDVFVSEVNLFLESDPTGLEDFHFSSGLEEAIDRDALFDFLQSENLPFILDRTEDTLQTLMNRGIVYNEDENMIPASGIVEVWREAGDNLDKTFLKYNQIPRLESLADYVANEQDLTDKDDSVVQAVLVISRFFVRENCFPDEFQTRLNKDLAASKVKPVEIYLAKGEKILEKGLVVTPEIESRLKAIRAAKGSGNRLVFISPLIFSAFLFAFAVLYLKVFSPEKAGNFQVSIIIYSALVLSVLISYQIILFAGTPRNLSPGIYIPVALFAMLVTLLINKKTGLIFQLILSTALYYISGFDLEFLVLPLLYGVTASLVIEGAARRLDMIRAGLIQGVSQAFFFVLFSIINDPGLYKALWGSSIMFVNGFISSILALGLLPVLEHWLKTSTKFRLIELSDSNAPVLKNMLGKAPGTYIHSMNVANLAEMACQEIGANTLLARVGGLYHDIGKVDQSEYFIENQTDVNKHDDMKPSLSAAVLKAHVKIGIEKAHDLKLPQDVIDIIAQHHATSTMKYFYDRALKEKGNTKVNKDDFSYSGPNPQTREAAIVMLADTIEAATRTLKKPSLAKLEKYVWELIMDKFICGELNDCSLTFKDMEYVKNSFVHVLAGHFHTRIEYPDDQRNKEKENDNE
ncbi:MAG: HDIG domain-containing protein [Spirochaetales bacterium]|nr:HDIG domain-containing protein [Spirochaetales bacterium]